MEQTRRESLYIPVNIKTRYEFFDGYGIAELFYSALTAAVTGCIALTIYAATNNTVLCVLIVLVSVAASVMALSKDQSNQSILDQLRFMVRFMRGQKKYPYAYANEWGD